MKAASFLMPWKPFVTLGPWLFHPCVGVNEGALPHICSHLAGHSHYVTLWVLSPACDGCGHTVRLSLQEQLVGMPALQGRLSLESHFLQALASPWWSMHSDWLGSKPGCCGQIWSKAKGPSFFVCLFFETGFLCSFGACPGTPSVDQAGLELTEIRLSLPSECWD